MSLTTAESPHAVAATVDRIIAALNQRGIRVFARVDHAGAARAVGLELADEQVLIFGDPRAGTLLMQEDPMVGHALPMRLLVWDAGGQTMVGYQPPPELAGDYHLVNQAELLERMGGLLATLVAESISPD